MTAPSRAPKDPPAVVPTTDALVEMELGGWVAHVRDVIFYARAAARSKGYALAVHGSLRRDVDLVAVPWTDEAAAPDELMEYIVETLINADVSYGGARDHAKQSREVKPLGRIGYSIPLKGIPAPYVDLSVAPRIPAVSAPPAGEREALARLVYASHGHSPNQATMRHAYEACPSCEELADEILAAGWRRVRQGGETP